MAGSDSAHLPSQYLGGGGKTSLSYTVSSETGRTSGHCAWASCMIPLLQ